MLLLSMRGIILAKDLICEPCSIILLVHELAARVDLILIQNGHHQKLDIFNNIAVDVTSASPGCLIEY